MYQLPRKTRRRLGYYLLLISVIVAITGTYRTDRPGGENGPGPIERPRFAGRLPIMSRNM